MLVYGAFLPVVLKAIDLEIVCVCVTRDKAVQTILDSSVNPFFDLIRYELHAFKKEAVRCLQIHQ